MDLDDLQVFAEIVRGGSFKAAARRLELPRSSVSRRLASLERELGVQLLQRTTRRLSVTDAGTRFFDRCTRALEEVQAARVELKQLQAEPSGFLRVTAPTGISSGRLSLLLHRFQERYPQITILLQVSNRYVDIVGEGVDVAFRMGELADSSLIAKRVGRGRRALYASPRYLQRAGRPASLQALSDHTCLLFNVRTSWDVWRFNGPNGVEEVRVSAGIVANDFAFLRRAAVEGAGVVYMPAGICCDEVEAGRLERVLPEYGTADKTVNLVYTPEQKGLPKVRSFIEFVKENFYEIFPEGDV